MRAAWSRPSSNHWCLHAGVVKEIAIMRMLQDHKNTVRLMDVYDQPEQYVLIMELCSGGELFDQIISKVCTSFACEHCPQATGSRASDKVMLLSQHEHSHFMLWLAACREQCFIRRPCAEPAHLFCVRCFVQGHFSEKDAAEKMQSLLDFIAYAHSKNIIHR